MLAKLNVTGKPAQARRDFQISNWRPCQKNTLRGFLTLTLPSGLIIHDCALHEHNRKRWIAFPARQYKKDDGTTSFKGLIEFADRTASERFRVAALAAVDRFMEGGHHE